MLLLVAATAVALPAQTFTTLHSFNYTDGAQPYASLIQATNGNLYGTTETAGANTKGTIFKITPSGTLTTLHSFDGTDGAYPYAGLIQAADGNFYGTTEQGGASNDGTIFKFTPGGTLTTLHSFNGTDGLYPYAGLVRGANGNFYGTTYYGGANGYGTVFKITPNGTLTTLHSFNNEMDGEYPYGSLVQATNGKFYGTTSYGGASGYGTLFKITPSGTLTTLYNFCVQTNCADGANPYGGLVQATNGTLYGTTVYGGAHSNGAVFKVTTSGTLTILYSFCTQTNCTDGANPYAGLGQATNGNFYGTTGAGGTNNNGTVFKITSNGTLTTMHTFIGTDGSFPYTGLVQDTNGTFYGTTLQGGVSSEGTVFSLSVGLGPFVKTNPTSGMVGAAVTILGTSLTGSTSVAFNGAAATFAVVSASEITTTVPTGATTGTVQVVTPGGTLKSNVSFTVN
jgi:uncharacterized repeat protein (TIGR03803 family)